VSESALQLLEEENVELREQQMEMDELKSHNTMLQDELDEVHTARAIGVMAPVADEDEDIVVAESNDLQFAFDMLQVQLPCAGSH
jgi:type II secretory pathway component PulM